MTPCLEGINAPRLHLLAPYLRASTLGFSRRPLYQDRPSVHLLSRRLLDFPPYPEGLFFTAFADHHPMSSSLLLCPLCSSLPPDCSSPIFHFTSPGFLSNCSALHIPPPLSRTSLPIYFLSRRGRGCPLVWCRMRVISVVREIKFGLLGFVASLMAAPYKFHSKNLSQVHDSEI